MSLECELSTMEFPKLLSEAVVTPGLIKTKSRCGEDSGYYTFTPSSSEATKSDIDAKENIGSRKDRGDGKMYKSRFLGQQDWTPGTPSKSRDASRKQAREKHFLKDISLNIDGGLNCGQHRSIPPIMEQCSDGNNSLLCSPDRKRKRSLKRQSGIEMISPSTSARIQFDSPVAVTRDLQNLAVCDETYQKFKKPRIDSSKNFNIDKCFEQDNLFECQDHYSDSVTSDYFSQSQLTFDMSRSALIYPTTPVKNLGSFVTRRERIQETPERTSASSDFIFAEQFLEVERKVAKSNVLATKIGTPEKNKLLYSTIKPVSPPRRPITPEKLKRAASKTKSCKKSLNLSGLCEREYVDFLKMLGEKQDQRPAIEKILSYLSGEDISRMCLVSQSWRKIVQNDHRANRRRKNHVDFRKRTKENLKCPNNCKSKIKETLSLDRECILGRMLVDIQNTNIMRGLNTSTPQRSPPTSPGKVKFKKFIKAASLGPCQLMNCTRCKSPAQVNRESNGERWVQCMSLNCGFTFCRQCLCERHVGHSCTFGGLEAPSPSKKKTSCTIGSKKSRRNLRRLLH